MKLIFMKKNKTNIITYTLIFVVFIIIIFMIINKREMVNDYDAHERNSIEFKKTQIISTLSDQADKTKNLIWCPSFQIAWNELKSYIHEDIKLDVTNELIENLNKSADYKTLLPQDSYYVFSGIIKEQDLNKIYSDIFDKFNVSLKIPELLEAQNNSLLFLSYFFMKIKFYKEFNQNNQPLIFNYSNATCEINSFGILADDEFKYNDLRDKVKILYIKENAITKTFDEVIIDPDYDESNEVQLVLAMTEFKNNLNETANYVIDKLKIFRSKKDKENELPQIINNVCESYNHEFNSTDTLLIPNINFKITHDLTNIKNKVILNQSLNNTKINNAIQVINFNLNRKGVELSSTAFINVGCKGGHFEFDQPFLIMLKSRHSDVPYFVLWIANDELLSKYKKL